MLYNTIEQAVVRWSENSLPVLVRLFGVDVTVSRQVPVEEPVEEPVVVAPEPEPTPEPEPEPDTLVEPEPEPEYVPPIPTAPSGFMGSVYGGMISLSSAPAPEPAPTPVPEAAPEPVPQVDQQVAVDDVYGSMAGPLDTTSEGAKFRVETFDTILIPPRRDWATAGTINIGGFEAVEVFAKDDLLEGDTLLFKRGDGSRYYYRVHRMMTLGITESLLKKTYLIPIEAEDFHG